MRQMRNAERVTTTDGTFRTHGEGDRALVFVHGFLDDQRVWDGVVAGLASSGFERVQVDLPGCGERAAASGPFTYERYAADVGAVVDALDKPFVIVPRSQAWREAFADRSAEEFAEALADDVVLEASVLHRPIEGRDLVQQVMATASGIYDSLVFIHEATEGPRTYVEWEATAFGGMRLNGVTILTKDDSGQIISARIHHRPLAAVLRFSTELRERPRGAVDPSHFYGGPDASR
jgi:pimeloyl-ACP methyl ester carboxylesterase